MSSAQGDTDVPTVPVDSPHFSQQNGPLQQKCTYLSPPLYFLPLERCPRLLLMYPHHLIAFIPLVAFIVLVALVGAGIRALISHITFVTPLPSSLSTAIVRSRIVPTTISSLGVAGGERGLDAGVWVRKYSHNNRLTSLVSLITIDTDDTEPITLG